MNHPIRIKRLSKGWKVPISRRLKEEALITVEVDRRNKAGALQYPYVYQIETVKLEEYPVIMIPGGWPGYKVPLRHFRKVAKRGELPFPLLREEGRSPSNDAVSDNDPALVPWRGYL